MKEIPLRTDQHYMLQESTGGYKLGSVAAGFLSCYPADT